MEKYSEPVAKYCTKIILDQMNKSFYKIKIEEEKFEIGFFFYIKYNNKKVPILIASNDIKNGIYNNQIDIIYNNIIKTIKLETIICEDKNLGLTIIEIKEEANKEINILEIDDRLYEKEEFNIYEESIYIIHYNDKFKDFSVSYGLLHKIENSKIIYSSNRKSNTKLSLIFNLSNNKIIGMHKSSSLYYNKGLLFKEIIDKIINIYNKTKEIHILINVQNFKYDKKIFFLNNDEGNNKESSSTINMSYNDSLQYLNNLNTILYINDEKCEYKKYFIPNKIEKYFIKLKIFFDLTNFKSMFSGCDQINSINFINFNNSNLIDMSYMFNNCKNLKNINLFSINTYNVKNMSHIFEGCENLTYLDLSSFNTKNVKDISYMFYDCKNLNKVDLSSFETKNVQNMSNMFNQCKNLKQIELSSFNIIKVHDISSMFYNCENLENINISSFNTEYVNNMENLFYNCKNLTNLNLYNFITINVKNMSNIFNQCENLKKINLSNFNTTKVINMSNMFNNCKNLMTLDLSSFNTGEVQVMCKMFYGCENLKLLNLSNFNTKKVRNMSNMFYGCENLADLDISSFNCDLVKNMDKMFYGCKNFIYKNLSLLSDKDYNNYRNEYFIEFIDKNNYLINKIKAIKLYDENGFIISKENKLFIMRKKKNNLQISQSLILNLIDANNKIEKKNYNEDCIILEYDVNNMKSFKDIEIFWNSNKANKNENILIYLI